MRAKREDVQVVELQGNVDTRLRRLAAGDVDALVLACAGLIRLGRESEISGVLDLVPAPGQGALLVQARIDDEQTRAVAAELNDPIAERCVMSERALASHLNATCNTPLGASAVPASDTDATLRAAVSASDTDVTLRAWIGLPDGSHWIQDELTGDASDVGSMVAERMIAAGASALLEQAERMALA